MDLDKLRFCGYVCYKRLSRLVADSHFGYSPHIVRRLDKIKEVI